MYGVIDCIEDGLDEQHFFLPDDMKFKKSWDWLMSVVEKIYEIAVDDENIEVFYEVSDNLPDRHETYKAVLEFINRYNKNK